jgi:ERF superfamily
VTTAPASLAEALAALQGQLPRVAKAHEAKVETRTGGNYKYAYADLTDVSAVLLPLLAKLGLSFTACPTLRDDSGEFVLTYHLWHVSGGDIMGWYPLPDPARVGPQDLGKAITYARRYALCAITGLAPGGDDDDAAGQQEAKARPRNVPDKQLASEGRMTRAQASEHDRTKADTLRGSRRAERSRPKAPDPDSDPWATDAPVDGHRAAALRETVSGPDLTDPEDKPGTILPAQHRAIESTLTKLGIGLDDRGPRHEAVCKLLDLPGLPPHPETGAPSMLGLSFTQAADALRMLQEPAHA